MSFNQAAFCVCLCEQEFVFVYGSAREMVPFAASLKYHTLRKKVITQGYVLSQAFPALRCKWLVCIYLYLQPTINEQKQHFFKVFFCKKRKSGCDMCLISCMPLLLILSADTGDDSAKTGLRLKG